ncbi:hypothetical protein [Shewanella jiangmenensis]|uniref:hypothetical protein n=1 Tax=Shewanella jiangmenensis TaxID=2837387 RepID=UPI001BDF2663|nr:hypothetical protein [Shewanella jiangmenensis]
MLGEDPRLFFLFKITPNDPASLFAASASDALVILVAGQFCAGRVWITRVGDDSA